MDSLANIGVLKLVVAAIIGYVVKMILDWALKTFVSPRPTKKFRFDKIPCETKVDILEKIKNLAIAENKNSAESKPSIAVQMKFLYEQMGIYLPVWHCHQLISCMAQENIGSRDIRLNGFLKNPFIGRCLTGEFYVDKKTVSWFYASIILFSIFSIAALAYTGLSTLHALLQTKQEAQFFIFLIIYVVSIFFVFAFSINEIEDIWQGVKFGNIFECWIQDKSPLVDIDTPAITPPALKLHHEE
ncbi:MULTISPECIES: hypothetical protein [Enterobacterales]|uniref:hypothetical protein n=1 Tax=Enterobacterales TaxID=91347 RepID=UPI002ED7AE08